METRPPKFASRCCALAAASVIAPPALSGSGRHARCVSLGPGKTGTKPPCSTPKPLHPFQASRSRSTLPPREETHPETTAWSGPFVTGRPGTLPVPVTSGESAPQQPYLGACSGLPGDPGSPVGTVLTDIGPCSGQCHAHRPHGCHPRQPPSWSPRARGGDADPSGIPAAHPNTDPIAQGGAPLLGGTPKPSSWSRRAAPQPPRPYFHAPAGYGDVILVAPKHRGLVGSTPKPTRAGGAEPTPGLPGDSGVGVP